MPRKIDKNMENFILTLEFISKSNQIYKKLIKCKILEANTDLMTIRAEKKITNHNVG